MIPSGAPLNDRPTLSRSVAHLASSGGSPSRLVRARCARALVRPLPSLDPACAGVGASVHASVNLAESWFRATPCTPVRTGADTASDTSDNAPCTIADNSPRTLGRTVAVGLPRLGQPCAGVGHAVERGWSACGRRATRRGWCATMTSRRSAVWEAELGYGLPAFGGAFTGTPNLGFGLSDSARDLRLGWRLTPAERGDSGFEVNLDATRREAAGDDAVPENAMRLELRVRF